MNQCVQLDCAVSVDDRLAYRNMLCVCSSSFMGIGRLLVGNWDWSCVSSIHIVALGFDDGLGATSCAACLCAAEMCRERRDEIVFGCTECDLESIAWVCIVS